MDRSGLERTPYVSVLRDPELAELELLRDAVDAATNVILITDPNLPDNPIVFVNVGFERLTGYARSEVLGKNCRFLQGHDRDQVGVKELRRAQAEKVPVVVRLRNYRKDGTPFWNELHVTPVFKHGTLRYFFGVQHDITERIRLEDLLLKAEDALLQQTISLKQGFAERHAYLNLLAQQMQRSLTTILGFSDVLVEETKAAVIEDPLAQHAAVIKDAARTLEVDLNAMLALLTIDVSAGGQDGSQQREKD